MRSFHRKPQTANQQEIIIFSTVPFFIPISPDRMAQLICDLPQTRLSRPIKRLQLKSSHLVYFFRRRRIIAFAISYISNITHRILFSLYPTILLPLHVLSLSVVSKSSHKGPLFGLKHDNQDYSSLGSSANSLFIFIQSKQCCFNMI